MGEEVKLHGMWASPFSRRVELALKLKAIPYQYIEEDLSNKTPSLLRYNPVHKKVPVLVHNDKPVAESMVIIEYMDETWENNPFLPRDPYERAMARFYAKFIDDKLLPTLAKLGQTAGKEKEETIKEIHEQLKVLEDKLKGKQFFGGQRIGYLDIVAMILVWLHLTGQKVLSTEKFPLIYEWIERVMKMEVVNECLIPEEKRQDWIQLAQRAPKSASN
ncbi:hypothetical protein Gotri_024402 [Gossypium trilobum]|uniref:glutathione transferase n=1 Tax=Gossypium trilobum TaxID=34281 RepID=A0A7J9DMA0_9ROSI|nr:hypothetical protein [Gossypium trilobum]